MCFRQNHQKAKRIFLCHAWPWEPPPFYTYTYLCTKHTSSHSLSPSHTQTTGIPESLYLKWTPGMFFISKVKTFYQKWSMWRVGCRVTDIIREVDLNIGMTRYNYSTGWAMSQQLFYNKKMKAERENEGVIMKCLSQTQIDTNLPRLQNTTFQTCCHSKFSPIIPRLIFKASLFPSLLLPQIPELRVTEGETEEKKGSV